MWSWALRCIGDCSSERQVHPRYTRPPVASHRLPTELGGAQAEPCRREAALLRRNLENVAFQLRSAPICRFAAKKTGLGLAATQAVFDEISAADPWLRHCDRRCLHAMHSCTANMRATAYSLNRAGVATLRTFTTSEPDGSRLHRQWSQTAAAACS